MATRELVESMQTSATSPAEAQGLLAAMYRCLWEIVYEQIAKRRFDRATRVVEEFRLATPPPAPLAPDAVAKSSSAPPPTTTIPETPYEIEFINRLIREEEFALALRWVKDADRKVGVLSYALRSDVRRHAEMALRVISEDRANLLPRFDVTKLIDVLIRENENLSGAQKYISAFGIKGSSDYAPETILERMLMAGQWEAAQAQARVFPALLRDKLSWEVLARRMCEKKDWPACLNHVQGVFGSLGSSLRPSGGPPLGGSVASATTTTKDSSTAAAAATTQQKYRPVLISIVEGMIRARRLFLAMRLVLAYRLEPEFPPPVLVATMIDEQQFHHALRFVRVLGMESQFASRMEEMRRARIASLVEFRRMLAGRRQDLREAFRRAGKPFYDEWDGRPEDFIQVSSLTISSRRISLAEAERRRSLIEERERREALTPTSKKAAKATATRSDNVLDGGDDDDDDDDEEEIVVKSSSSTTSGFNEKLRALGLGPALVAPPPPPPQLAHGGFPLPSPVPAPHAPILMPPPHHHQHHHHHHHHFQPPYQPQLPLQPRNAPPLPAGTKQKKKMIPSQLF